MPLPQAVSWTLKSKSYGDSMPESTDLDKGDSLHIQNHSRRNSLRQRQAHNSTSRRGTSCYGRMGKSDACLKDFVRGENSQ